MATGISQLQPSLDEILNLVEQEKEITFKANRSHSYADCDQCSGRTLTITNDLVRRLLRSTTNVEEKGKGDFFFEDAEEKKHFITTKFMKQILVEVDSSQRFCRSGKAGIMHKPTNTLLFHIPPGGVAHTMLGGVDKVLIAAPIEYTIKKV